MKIKYLSLFFVLTILISCATKVQHYGHNVEQEDIAKIKVAKSTKEDVVNIIGTPSTASEYGDEIWYYIYSKTESVAFIKPTTKERNVTAIVFNKKDIVIDIQKFTLDNGNNISFANEITESKGTRGNIITHFMKNVGRFNTTKRLIPSKPKGL